MKFLCPNCKAKYQISDEKIAGRTLKMDCRRCSHPIVIRGDKVDAEASARASRPSQVPAQPAARRRVGSYAGPAPTARSSARTPLGAEFRKAAASPVAPQKPTALDQWHVAINDVPVGPMKREEVARKIETGAVKEDSLCWREGFDDWRPLKDVAELAPLLRRHVPGAKPPPVPPPPARALGSRGSSPPVARPRPVAPRPAQEAARPAAASMSGRGNVVPIGGRIGAAAAPAMDDIDNDIADDEPTRVGTAVDFERLEANEPMEEQRVSSVPYSPPSAMAADAASASAFGGPGASFAPESEAFDPFASQRAPNPMAPAVIQQPVGPAPMPFAQPPQGLPPGPGSYAQFAPPDAAVDTRRRGLPVGAWIAIAGAMAFGVALAIMVAAQLFKDQAPQVVINQPQPMLQQPQEAQPDPDVPAQPVAQPQQEGAPAQAVAQPQGRNGTARQSAGQPAVAVQQPQPPAGGERRPQRQLSPEEAARLARFEDDGAGAAAINVPTGGNPLAEQRPAGGGELSADQIRTVVNRERSGVQRCYNNTLRVLGRAEDIRVDVAVTVGGSGAVSNANVSGSTFSDLNDCIEGTVRRWRFPATGGTTTVNIPFVFHGSE